MQTYGSLCIIFPNATCGSFIRKILDSYFKLPFVMTKVYSRDAKLGSCFELSFIMEEVGNINENLVD